MANPSWLTPRPSKCPECLGGRVGLDECTTCAGTGTIFKVCGRTFPDTPEGFKAASDELIVDEVRQKDAHSNIVG